MHFLITIFWFRTRNLTWLFKMYRMSNNYSNLSPEKCEFDATMFIFIVKSINSMPICLHETVEVTWHSMLSFHYFMYGIIHVFSQSTLYWIYIHLLAILIMHVGYDRVWKKATHKYTHTRLIQCEHTNLFAIRTGRICV